MRRAGWEVWHYPPARVVHVGGASLARDPAAPSEYYRSLRYFYAKHYGRLAGALLAPLLLVYRRGVR